METINETWHIGSPKKREMVISRSWVVVSAILMPTQKDLFPRKKKRWSRAESTMNMCQGCSDRAFVPSKREGRAVPPFLQNRESQEIFHRNVQRSSSSSTFLFSFVVVETDKSVLDLIWKCLPGLTHFEICSVYDTLCHFRLRVRLGRSINWSGVKVSYMWASSTMGCWRLT